MCASRSLAGRPCHARELDSHKGILSWGWSEATSTVCIAYKHTFAPSDQLVNKLYHTPTTLLASSHPSLFPLHTFAYLPVDPILTGTS